MTGAKSKKKFGIKQSYVIAVGIALAAIIWIMSGIVFAPSGETAPAQSEAPQNDETKKIIEVRVRRMEAEPVVDDVVITGRTFASRDVMLKSETEGLVAEVVVDKGDAVTQGQIIARLDERDRQARVAEAKERLAQREIEYNAASALEAKGFNSKVRAAQSKADLEAARAALKQAEIALANTEIKAPFDGMIDDQYIEIGDFLSVGDTVFSIVDLDPVDVRGFVTEHEVVKITPGGPAVARFIDGSTAQGRVSYVAPAADNDTRTFAIEVSIPNPDGKIVDGMTTQIRIPTQERQAHKISPAILSLNDEGVVGVKLVNEENKVEFAPVNILSDQPGSMLVDGLPDKATVITVGQEYVVPGQTVKPVEAETDGLL